ncbi:MAG: YlxR family protein [Actinomycetaceae bacterium]|nr:YlxR family protein [Actinomycetaceae bacterium]
MRTRDREFKISWRTCIGCRETASTSELIRCAYNEELGEVVWDSDRRMPGRGAWIHPREACLGRAKKMRAFERALRLAGSGSQVVISVELSTERQSNA